jgi:hypothetical protein
MTCRTCEPCFKDFVSSFVAKVTVLADLMPGEDYYWRIEDGFGNVYFQAFTADAEGAGQIDFATLPKGIANAGSAPLLVAVVVEPNDCDFETLTLDKTETEFLCFEVSFRDGSTTKDYIGCLADIAVEWSWSATDPKAAIEAGTFNFVAQGSSSIDNFSSDLVADVHLMPQRSFAIVRVRNAVDDKTSWFDTGAPANSGSIPDQVFHPIIVQGGFDWYVNRKPMTYDNGVNSRLKLTNN